MIEELKNNTEITEQARNIRIKLNKENIERLEKNGQSDQGAGYILMDFM